MQPDGWSPYMALLKNGYGSNQYTLTISSSRDKGNYDNIDAPWYQYKDSITKQLETVGTTAYTVDADGFVSVTITHCSDYVLLPKAVHSILLDT